MVALLNLLASLLLAAPALSAPVEFGHDLKLPRLPLSRLCDIPIIDHLFCPVARTNTKAVKTPLGTATGVQEGSAYRYVVRYASAARWAQSTVANTWSLPYVIHSVER
jgi:hypothetical protein